MKTTVRINSTIKNGIGGAESGHLELIYMYLLHEYGQNLYSHIGINQIGDEVDEIILKEGKKIYINIRYPLPKGIESMNIDEKKLLALEVVHAALMRVALHENRLDDQILEKILNRIKKVDFSFDFLCKEYRRKGKPETIVKILVKPFVMEFKYYLQIVSDGVIKCELYLFSGATIPFNEQDFFYKSIWKSSTELVINDRDNELQFLIDIQSCKFELINLTRYSHPPKFTMMRKDITRAQREQAGKDWEHSLPPAIAAIIRQADN